MKRLFLFSTLCTAFLLLMFTIPILLPSASAQIGAQYVGADTCKQCHEDRYNSFLKSVHGKKYVPGSPATGDACEACHGPGSIHVEKGGGRGQAIFAFSKKDDPREKAGKCLACHRDAKMVTFWDMGKHKAQGISCDDCHSSHTPLRKNLRAMEPGLCYGCHKPIRAQAMRQSHHPINEGKTKCTACHQPHGGFGPKMVKADATNELCYQCHTEKRGPFMFEHPPVEENCLNCHTPHGSNHTGLLVRKAPQLCQSCHDWTQHPGTPYTQNRTFQGGAPSNRMFGRACLSCHSTIHGSNGPSNRGLRFLR
jgi:DmsE family decaheme c-type cytochrome